MSALATAAKREGSLRVLYGLAFLITGTALAFATWNARKSGKMWVNVFYPLIEYREIPTAFQWYLVGRFAIAALAILAGSAALIGSLLAKL
jgi:hypothetical protein